jgi:hypothetical protein
VKSRNSRGRRVHEQTAPIANLNQNEREKNAMMKQARKLALLAWALSFCAFAYAQGQVLTQTEKHDNGLTIQAGNLPKAAEGKFLVMTVNGVETPIAAGTYEGKVVLEVLDGTTKDLVGQSKSSMTMGGMSGGPGGMSGGPGGGAPGGAAAGGPGGAAGGPGGPGGAPGGAAPGGAGAPGGSGGPGGAAGGPGGSGAPGGMSGGPGGGAPGGAAAGGPGGSGPGAMVGGGEMEGPGDTTASVYRSALHVANGSVDPTRSATSALVGGSYDAKSAKGVSITAKSPKFNGITLVSTPYTITNLTTDISSDGGNDMSGLGSAVAVFQGANLNLSNSKIVTHGTARSGVFAGSYDIDNPAKMTIKDSTIVSYGNNKREPTSVWMLGLFGDVRALQMVGYYDNNYDNITVKSAGWAIVSVDGVKPPTQAKLAGLASAYNEANAYGGKLPHEFFDLYFWSGKNTIKNSDLSILPASEGGWEDGYGSYSIGANLNIFDHTALHNVSYASIAANEYASVSFVNGSTVDSKRFGIYSHSNQGGVLHVDHSTINTKMAAFLIKSGGGMGGGNNSPQVEVNHGKLVNSGDGVLFLLMDNDDPGGGSNFTDASGKVVDQKVEFKDKVATKDAKADLTKEFNWAKGAFMEGGASFMYNSNVVGYFTDCNGDAALNGNFYNARTDAQNLVFHFSSSTINGVISSGSTTHFVDMMLKSKKMTDANYEKDGVRYGNRNNMGEVKTAASPMVNNGVIVYLQKGSVWTVKDTSYLSKLVVSADSKVKGSIKADNTTKGTDGSVTYMGVVVKAS